MQVQFPLILDGATGTELQKRGFTGAVSAEEWVLAHPESILDIQRRYVDAGSRVLYAPSFGANRQKLEEHGIFNQTAAYNRRLAALSKQAAAGRALVAGDLSPTGLFLSPMGETSFRELVDIYTPQAAGLAEAGVDLFVIETMMTGRRCWRYEASAISPFSSPLPAMKRAGPSPARTSRRPWLLCRAWAWMPLA